MVILEKERSEKNLAFSPSVFSANGGKRIV
jgi:hypothetical protein